MHNSVWKAILYMNSKGYEVEFSSHGENYDILCITLRDGRGMEYYSKRYYLDKADILNQSENIITSIIYKLFEDINKLRTSDSNE